MGRYCLIEVSQLAGDADGVLVAVVAAMWLLLLFVR